MRECHDLLNAVEGTLPLDRLLRTTLASFRAWFIRSKCKTTNEFRPFISVTVTMCFFISYHRRLHQRDELVELSDSFPDSLVESGDDIDWVPICGWGLATRVTLPWITSHDVDHFPSKWWTSLSWWLRRYNENFSMIRLVVYDLLCDLNDGEMCCQETDACVMTYTAGCKHMTPSL